MSRTRIAPTSLAKSFFDIDARLVVYGRTDPTAHLTLGNDPVALKSDGTFAMWSDDPPDEDFTALLGSVFTDAEAQSIWFDNPITRGRSAATIYLATRAHGDGGP